MALSKLVLLLALMAVVMAKPILIDVPSRFSVPQKDCATLKISIPGSPNNLTISFQMGNIPSRFNISTKSLVFSGPDNEQSLVLCSRSEEQQGEFPITMKIENNSQEEYKLINGGALMVFIVKRILPGPAAVIITLGSTTKTSGTYKATASGQGNVYYGVWDQAMREDSYDFAIIKQRAQSDTGMGDKPKWIGRHPSDFWANYVMARGGTADISFDDLTPSSNYTLCVFFQATNSSYSSPTCATVTTQDGSLTKAIFNFTRKIDPAELNRLLCYIVSFTNSQIIYVMTITGESCNPFGKHPTNYRYNYEGKTLMAANATIIYILSPGNDHIMVPSTVFESMFSREYHNLTKDAVNAMAEIGINYIKESMLLDPVTISTLLSRRKPFPVQLKVSVESATRDSKQVSIQNVKSSLVGTVYFVLVSNNSGEASLRQPTAERIVNCRNADNVTAANCTRIVFTTPSSTASFKFQNLKANTDYRLYYATANQFPRYVIMDEAVNEVKQNVIAVVEKPKQALHATFVLALLLLIFIM